MADREKVIEGLEEAEILLTNALDRSGTMTLRGAFKCLNNVTDALAMFKEQEEKLITLHKKHVITWNRNDQFSMKNLYEAICETLLDEGELFIARTDNHEKVEFVFYVAEGR